MLMPDDKNRYSCDNDDFNTNNIFEYLDHSGIEFQWMVKLSRKYNFNMFTFLEQLAWLLIEENYDEAWHSVQGVALLFTNSCGDDFEDFIKEAEVISGTDEMFEQIDQFLKESNRDDS